jgi:uncharacterized protein
MKKFLPVLLLCILNASFAQKAIPELWGLHVHDEAHILSQQTVDDLEAQLKTYEDSTSNQIAILTITSLENEVLEQYSLKVAEKWKLGNKEKDNGALLLIAVDDHKMRIETGQGLQGVLTDAVCNRIIRNEMAPNFRRGDYDQGVNAAITAMKKAIGGEYKADGTEDAAAQTADMTPTEKILISLFIFGILGIFTVIALFIQDKGAWIFYAFLIPFYAIFPMAVLGFSTGLIGLIIYLVGFPLVRMFLARTPWWQGIAKKLKSSSGGSNGSSSGWSSSNWSSGDSSDSSSSSNSDFSGGGGSFDGGGSSGSW